LNGSAKVSMKKARCNAMDPVVMVNMGNKTYVPYAKAMAGMKNGMCDKTSSQIGMSNMKSVYASAAKSMGYEMMSSKPM